MRQRVKRWFRVVDSAAVATEPADPSFFLKYVGHYLLAPSIFATLVPFLFSLLGAVNPGTNPDALHFDTLLRVFLGVQLFGCIAWIALGMLRVRLGGRVAVIVAFAGIVWAGVVAAARPTTPVWGELLRWTTLVIGCLLVAFVMHRSQVRGHARQHAWVMFAIGAGLLAAVSAPSVATYQALFDAPIASARWLRDQVTKLDTSFHAFQGGLDRGDTLLSNASIVPGNVWAPRPTATMLQTVARKVASTRVAYLRTLAPDKLKALQLLERERDDLAKEATAYADGQLKQRNTPLYSSISAVTTRARLQWGNEFNRIKWWAVVGIGSALLFVALVAMIGGERAVNVQDASLAAITLLLLLKPLDTSRIDIANPFGSFMLAQWYLPAALSARPLAPPAGPPTPYPVPVSSEVASLLPRLDTLILVLRQQSVDIRELAAVDSGAQTCFSQQRATYLRLVNRDSALLDSIYRRVRQ